MTSEDSTSLSVANREPGTAAKPVEQLSAKVYATNNRVGLRTKLGRLANILRYYRTSQLAQRAMRIVLPKVLTQRSITAPAPEPQIVREHSLEAFRSIATTRSVRSNTNARTLLDELSVGKFTLLSESRELGIPADWTGTTTPHPSRLWHFQLHYHEYLLDLARGSASEDIDAWPLIWQIVADWIGGNSPETLSPGNDAWHPYCISRRLPVWTQLFALSEPPEELRDNFLRSFAAQATTLSKTLEFDLGGNHLLENLTALSLAGVFLAGPQSDGWLELAERHLRDELPRQILSHGEHYERAPMYHCQVLGNLLQVFHATVGVSDNLSELCRKEAGPMVDFLHKVLHPDGEIPLFGDSCWGETHAAADIDALARLTEITPIAKADGVSNVGNYWTWHQADDALIFDAGPVGADELPAHAHCDLLGFEASLEGQRWFVDSGLFDYEDGEMRAYCRSSSAHNVVTLGYENSCDVWSRFRMGRRGRPTEFEHGQQGKFSWCLASHDGYRHLGVPKLSRLFVMHSSGVWTCLDHASSSAKLPATGPPLLGRLHLAPGIQVKSVENGHLSLFRGDTERWLLPTAGIKLELAAGWYCDRFGQRQQTQVIVYRSTGHDSVNRPFGWSLQTNADSNVTVSTSEVNSNQVQVTIDGSSDTFSRRFPT